MPRECEVCGRPLKTGRKYCYVCRSLQKARNIKERTIKYDRDKMLLGYATDKYRLYRLGIFLNFIYNHSVSIGLGGFIFFEMIAYLFVVGNISSSFGNSFAFIGFFWIIILFILHFFIKKRIKKIDEEIKVNSSEYTEYIKKIVKIENENTRLKKLFVN